MEAGKTVDLLRRIRHDFANHLQVVSGYLDMGRPEKAKQYLAEVIEGMAAEKVVFKLLPEQAALYLYEQLILAQDSGIILRYEDLDLKSWEILKAKGEPGRTLEIMSRDESGNQGEIPVHLSIYEDETGIDLFVSCDAWTPDYRKIRVNKE